MRFIVRVDDVGQAEIQSQRDAGMATFAKWWEPWRGLPVYCGVVPAGLTADEFAWIEANIPAPCIAIHGWDHAQRCLTPDDVARAVQVLPEARVVIPPYNLYDAETVRAIDCHIKGTPVLLGGFGGKDHPYGEAPRQVGVRTFHISALHVLYDRSYRLADIMDPANLTDSLPCVDYPLQVVLHHRWDIGNLDGVKRLRDFIADKMVSVDMAVRYAEENQ